MCPKIVICRLLANPASLSLDVVVVVYAESQAASETANFNASPEDWRAARLDGILASRTITPRTNQTLLAKPPSGSLPSRAAFGIAFLAKEHFKILGHVIAFESFAKRLGKVMKEVSERTVEYVCCPPARSAQRLLATPTSSRYGPAALAQTRLPNDRFLRRINPTKLGMAVLATIGIAGELVNVAASAVFAADLFDGHGAYLFGWVACLFTSIGWLVALASDRHSTGEGGERL
jgi:hypothetical protein